MGQVGMSAYMPAYLCVDVSICLKSIQKVR